MKNLENRTVKKASLNGRLILILVLCVILAAGIGLGAGFLGYRLADRGGDSASRVTEVILRDNSENTAAKNDSPASLADVIESVADTVTAVETDLGSGSGVIITSTGYIITNHHVIAGASEISVALRSGEKVTARLVGSDEKSDIAVLKIEAENLKAAVFADSNQLRVGQTVFAIGNPLGELAGTVTDGIVSALNREVEIEGVAMTLIQTNAGINPGNSGGGLFDSAGRLVGIVNAKCTGEDVESLGFAIPSNDALSAATELMEKGYISGRIDTGIAVAEISDYMTLRQNGLTRAGLYVTEVTSGNGSAFAVKDYIASVNGITMTTEQELNRLLDGCAVGDTLIYSVIRGNQQLTVTQTLTEKIPANAV